MAAESYANNLYSPTAEAGNYNAQRQLDYRLAGGGSWRITSPMDRGTSSFLQSRRSHEESDFKIAMSRRNEPEGASLTEMGKKYGL
jgi:hypothetical protein